MALANIVINDGQGTPVAHTFEYIGSDAGKVTRSDLTRSPEVPLLLTIGHQTNKKGGTTVDSHLLKIESTVLDTDGMTLHKPNIRLMADCPVAVYSDALADDFAAYVRNWATSANVRAWLRKSVF